MKAAWLTSEFVHNNDKCELRKDNNMIERTLSELVKMFKSAEGEGYVGIVVSMKGFPKNEIIINPIDNVNEKIEYYSKTYDDELNHKYADGIKIEMFWSDNNIGTLTEYLSNWI